MGYTQGRSLIGALLTIVLLVQCALATLEDNNVISDEEKANAQQCALKMFHGPVMGGPKEIPREQYPQLLSHVTKTLSSLKAVSDGQDEITGVYNIYCATTQVVSGSLKKINGQFQTSKGNLKDCIMSIWSRPWIPNGTQVTLNCDLPNKIVQRKRRSIHDSGRRLYERVKELIPGNNLLRANGQPLFEKAEQIYVAMETIEDGNKQYIIRGKFTMPNDEEDICEMNLLQQSNRLNIFKWKCVEDETELVFSFYPSVLTIPHSKRTKDQKLFAKFILSNNRDYAHTPEEEDRFKIFSRNLQKIKLFNEMEEGTAKYGITEFADMTDEEYSQKTGLRYSEYVSDRNHIPNPKAEIPNKELPKSFDWREKGAITQVKNQGACGSCWAFSVTGNIEGIHAVKTGKLEEYSEQELVDCDSIDHGCGGGLPDNAYKAIENIGGLELENDYPYKGRQNKCTFNKTMSHVRVKGAIDFPKNETAMALWLVDNGPISIGINANAMQFYRGGISHPWRMLCRHSAIDHGVLIVGFGVADYPVFNKTLPYWIVKNSWGKTWGEQGYYRVFRGDDTCGVGEMASSAVLAD